MIIIPTGFFDTGSSAITHLFMEIEGVKDVESTYEIRLLFDPDTIRDLEYHLIENPHRHNTNFAIKRFKKWIDFNSNPLMNHHYNRLCNGDFKQISYEYIEELCELKYHGSSHIDAYDAGKIRWFAERCIGKIDRTFFSTNRPKWMKTLSFSNHNILFCGTYDKERFLNATQTYLKKIIHYLNPEGAKWLIVDQMLPPTDVGNYLSYFPENEKIRVFIVDRDPRDLFVICKYYAKTNAIPTESVDLFCRWYLWTRGQSSIKPDPPNVKRIQFEDLIYEYAQTRQTILEHCNIKESKNAKCFTHFDPRKSINNTQVWRRYPEAKEEIMVIEKKLSKFCYPFETKDLKPDFNKGKMFEC